MTAQPDQKRVEMEAARICAAIERLWPEVSSEVGLETQEGEDAYVWLSVPDRDYYDVLIDASQLSVDLYNDTGIYILPMPTRKGAE